MCSKKASLSLLKFREDFNEIFNNVIALRHFEILYFIQSTSKVSSNEYKTEKSFLFEPLKKFEERNFMNNHFFAYLISAMEVYFQDRIVEEINNHPEKLNKLIKEYKWSRKFTPEDVINGPVALANELMGTIVFHKLNLVNTLFKIVLNIDILKILNDKRVWESIKIRHQIVHHTGKIGKEKIYITTSGLINTMNSISKWVENIDYFYRTKKTKKNSTNFFNKYYKNEEQLRKLYPEKVPLLDGIKLSRTNYFNWNKEYESDLIKIN